MKAESPPDYSRRVTCTKCGLRVSISGTVVRAVGKTALRLCGGCQGVQQA